MKFKPPGGKVRTARNQYITPKEWVDSSYSGRTQFLGYVERLATLRLLELSKIPHILTKDTLRLVALLWRSYQKRL